MSKTQILVPIKRYQGYIKLETIMYVAVRLLKASLDRGIYTGLISKDKIEAKEAIDKIIELICEDDIKDIYFKKDNTIEVKVAPGVSDGYINSFLQNKVVKKLLGEIYDNYRLVGDEETKKSLEKL